MDGNIVTEQSFVGKWTLLYFGFARCPDICPSEMNKVARVMDTLKQQYPELYKKIVPVFVSVDPARDSIQVLKNYAKDFHPDYIFLTGTPEQVQHELISTTDITGSWLLRIRKAKFSVSFRPRQLPRQLLHPSSNSV